MKPIHKILLALLATAVVLGSFPADIFSVSYTYREPVAIVDETIKKTSGQGLKKKLARLEEALKDEVRRQMALKRWEAERDGESVAGFAALPPAPAADRPARGVPAAGKPANG